MDNIIEFRHITKRFPGSLALNDVSFSVKRGEVHALLGENGAGKSTLLNILHGVYSTYEGEFQVDGKTMNFYSAHDALEYGIAKVHQEVSVVEDLTAGQNIALGIEPRNKLGLIDFAEMYRRTDAILEKLGCRYKSSDLASTLSVGEKQMILIAKALLHNAKIISFDEPTAALTDRETERLFAIINELKENGITILYVTHRMAEVAKIVDRATVLRDGKYIETYEMAATTRDMLIHSMVGRDISAFAVRNHPNLFTDEIVLDVKQLSGEKFHDVSFALHKGEIFSFSGLIGAGRTEVMRVLFGADKKLNGTIMLKGREVTMKSPEHAMEQGISLIPENRKTQGFVHVFDNSMNIAIASMKKFRKFIFTDHKAVRENCEKYIKVMRLSPPDPEYMTTNLSGGNQQKVIVAKWLTTDSEVLIFDEPTKGIDVGAKAEIYALMEELASQGKAIIMVSSELPEVIGMSDRVAVMRGGELVKILQREELSEETILHYAMEG